MFGPVSFALADCEGARKARGISTVLSYLELTKTRITSLVVFTTASGLWLAPVQPQRHTVLLTLIGTALVVAANALNTVDLGP
jgi:heme O synthase-like polyprenyltransferase